MDTRYPMPADLTRPIPRFIAPGGVAESASLGTWVPIEYAEALAEENRALKERVATLKTDLAACDQLNRGACDRIVALEAEVAIRRRQQDEAAATIREALDEQGRLRLENQRLKEATAGEDRRVLAELRNAVTVACTCGGGGGPYDSRTCPACHVWHQLA